jgi:tetratricopeptide (TPR) repeat protein
MDPTVGEVDAASAADALARGDWEAALAGLADALSNNPFRPEWTALLERALTAGGTRADAVLRKSGENWVGYRGLRAYAEHQRGAFASAFDTLERLTRDCRWNLFPEAWGFAWITPDAARAAGAQALEFLFTATERYPEGLPEWFQQQLGRAVVALEIVETVVGADDRTTLLKGQMLGKAGRFAEAIALTEGAANANPTFRTATAAAMANRRAGAVESAIRWFRRAAELDPKNATSFLDIGDTYVALERWQDAIDAYEQAMARKPWHDWAYPSAVYCSYRLTGDPDALNKLRAMANAPLHQCSELNALKAMNPLAYTSEDRRKRAQYLMREIEPDFVSSSDPPEPDEEE